MKITDKTNPPAILRVRDVEPGEVFKLTTNDHVYLMGRAWGSSPIRYVINLGSGTTNPIEDPNTPCKRVNAELVIS